MSDGNSVLFTLTLLSGMLAAVMALAARVMEDTVHARFWCAAFLTASISWGLNFGYSIIEPVGGLGFVLLVSTLSMIVPLLLLRGFEERAGNVVRRRWLIAVGLVCVMIVIIADLRGAAGLWAATSQSYRAVVVIFILKAVVPAGRPARVDEKAMIALLSALFILSVVVALLALGRQFEATAQLGELDRWLLLLALPPIFAGIGLVAMTIIAIDLATRLRRLALTDQLTGIDNRRGFEEAALPAIGAVGASGRQATLALIDLDHFKQINDVHGHHVGDQALRDFAACVGAMIGPDDLFARTGGEEFSLILFGRDGHAAETLVEDIRRAVAAMRVDGMAGRQLTASFGVTRIVAGEGEVALRGALRRADGGLYRSKADGRNRITCVPPEPGASAASSPGGPPTP